MDIILTDKDLKLKKNRAIVYTRCPLSLIDLLRSVEKYKVYDQFNFIVAYEDLPEHKYHYDKIQKEFSFMWRYDGIHPMLLNSYIVDIFMKNKSFNFLYLRENARFIRPVVLPNDPNMHRRGIINLKKGIHSDSNDVAHIRYKHDFDKNPSMNGVIICRKNLLNFANGLKLQGHQYHYPYKTIELIGDPECES